MQKSELNRINNTTTNSSNNNNNAKSSEFSSYSTWKRVQRLTHSSLQRLKEKGRALYVEPMLNDAIKIEYKQKFK